MLYVLIAITAVFLYGVVRFYDGLIRGLYKKIQEKETNE